MIRNIRHIQIKKIAYHPNLFKAILTFEKHPKEEYIEYLENQKTTCPSCDEMAKRRKDYVKSKFG